MSDSLSGSAPLSVSAFFPHPSQTLIDGRWVFVSIFDLGGLSASDWRLFLVCQCSETAIPSTYRTREAKNLQFSAQTVRLEASSSRHYGLLSRPGQESWRSMALCGTARSIVWPGMRAISHDSHASLTKILMSFWILMRISCENLMRFSWENDILMRIFQFS